MLDYKMLYYKMLYYKFRIGSKFPEWSGTPEWSGGVATPEWPLRNATPDWRVEWSGHSGVVGVELFRTLPQGLSNVPFHRIWNNIYSV